MWTQHIKDPKKKEEFATLVRNSSLVLGRLYEILSEQQRALDKNSVSISDFDSPSWPYKQAFLNGSKDQIEKLKSLIEFTKG